MHPAGGQAGEPALKFRAPPAVTRDEDHQVGEPPPRAPGLPSSNAIFQPPYSVDHDVEVFVFGPTRRTDDEADQGRMDAQPSHQRLTVPFAIDTIHRDEDRRGPIVEHARVLETEPALQELRETSRHTKVCVSM